MTGTGLVESWNANPSEIGPLYPFTGPDIVGVVLVVGFWLAWTVWQVRAERAEHAATARAVRESAQR